MMSAGGWGQRRALSFPGGGESCSLVLEGGEVVNEGFLDLIPQSLLICFVSFNKDVSETPPISIWCLGSSRIIPSFLADA